MLSILYSPEELAPAKYGVGATTMYPDISGCTLHNRETIPGVSNLNERISPLGQVPMLWLSFLLPETEGQKMLCCTLSPLRKSTIEPTRTTVAWGWNSSDFWSIEMCLSGAGNVLSGMASMTTTAAPFPPLIFPLTLPP